MAKEFSGTVKTILGTAQTLGLTVDGMHVQAVLKQMAEGQIQIPEEETLENYILAVD